MATKKTTTTKTASPKVPPSPEEHAPEEFVTEFAVGVDGHLYVNAESFKPGDEIGREKFVGYKLTEEEAHEVWGEMHRIAFNATAPLRRKKAG